MNTIEKSEAIRIGLRKGFQDGTSKMAQRRCYGYDTGLDGELVIMPRYLYSDSHEPIIPDKIFKAVQQEKKLRTNCPNKVIAIQDFF